MIGALSVSHLPCMENASVGFTRNLQAKDATTKYYLIIFCAFSGAILLLLLINAYLQFRRRPDNVGQPQATSQTTTVFLDEKEIESIRKEFILNLLPIRVCIFSRNQPEPKLITSLVYYRSNMCIDFPRRRYSNKN